MQKVWMIGIAGLIGTLARYALSGWIARHMGERFPAGTLAVNLMGCFFVGALYYLMQERFLFDPAVRSALMIGFLGGFTTFSSYGLQTFTLMRDGQMLYAALNIVASNLGGLVLVWFGYGLAKMVR